MAPVSLFIKIHQDRDHIGRYGHTGIHTYTHMHTCTHAHVKELKAMAEA